MDERVGEGEPARRGVGEDEAAWAEDGNDEAVDVWRKLVTRPRGSVRRLGLSQLALTRWQKRKKTGFLFTSFMRAKAKAQLRRNEGRSLDGLRSRIDALLQKQAAEHTLTYVRDFEGNKVSS